MHKENLHRIQEKFQHNIRNDLLKLDFISSNNAEERFDVYKKSIINILRSVLEKAYPSLWKLLPNTNANFLAYQFIANNFPSTGVLHEWGDKFPLFIKKNNHIKKYPFLYDFASYDQLKNKCYNATSVTTLCTKKLKNITKSNIETITFCFKPSLFLYESAYPIPEIEQILENKKEDFLSVKTHNTYAAMVQNKDFYPITYWLNKELYSFIKLLENKINLVQASTYILKEHPHFNLAQNFSTIINMGIVHDLNSSNHTPNETC